MFTLKFRSWRTLARTFDGWAPPMLLLFCGFLGIGFAWLLAKLTGIKQLRGLMLFTWLGMCFLGAASMVAATCEAARAARRMGFFGWTRSRWWFELGRVSWFAFVAGAAMLPAALFVEGFGAPVPWPDWLFHAGKIMAGCSLPAFAVAAAVGYVLSLITRRPRIGRAYECVHTFFTNLGGIALVGGAAWFWPPGNLWPDAVVLIALGLAGVVLIAIGLVTFSRQYDRNRAKEQLRLG